MSVGIAIFLLAQPGCRISESETCKLAGEQEANGELKQAAELYLRVDEAADVYELALLGAARCLRQDAEVVWLMGRRKPEEEAAAKKEFRQAEEVLLKLAGRLNGEGKQSSDLALEAYEELARIYLHEAVGRATECLESLKKCEGAMPAGDERLADILALEVRAHLKLSDVASAVRIVDAMFEKYPDKRALTDACRMTAIRLDEAAAEMVKAGAAKAAVAPSWMKISRYYRKWLEVECALGGSVQVNDVVSAAEVSYLIAKELDDAQCYENAAFIYELLAPNPFPDRERIKVLQRLARCRAALAVDLAGWEKARDVYEWIFRDFKLLTKSNELDEPVLQKFPELLQSYLELGGVYRELGKVSAELKYQFANAIAVFVNVCGVSEKATPLWWQTKYMIFATLVDRGAEGDVDDARIGLRNLERNYPDFDGGPWKDRFQELKKRVGITGSGK